MQWLVALQVLILAIGGHSHVTSAGEGQTRAFQWSNDLASSTPNNSISSVSITGYFNQYGTDAGLCHEMKEADDGTWSFDLLTQWPTTVTVNASEPRSNGTTSVDEHFVILNGPQYPSLAWQLELDKDLESMSLIAIGSQQHQIIVYSLLASIPILTATIGVLLFIQSYYQVKFNKYGVTKRSFLPSKIERIFRPSKPSMKSLITSEKTQSALSLALSTRSEDPGLGVKAVISATRSPERRRILVATMEYDIEDWAIKIKIGGLGVMAQLMGKNLGHQDLIWVVPCVGDVDYPQVAAEEAEPMIVSIMGNPYHIQVRTHVLRNITYVLLDAPVFRKQTKSDPYPERMDDLESAIYYSAWNQCIAETLRRYNPHLYHINDYHGAIAPLHLLPQTIPCCLSLHNAEFQGLWPMRNEKETDELCKTYNLPLDVVKEYVQFGEVFNLLHAGANYLRVHQNGFGAVGVSKKYGKRSFARYPIFWGLQNIGALPNPDPSDTAAYNTNDAVTSKKVKVDEVYESARGGLRKQAQEWAGLDVDPDAELFVFVGRWSMQKGIDLIADVFPGILSKHSKAQLICIGPVIDLYGRFAAIKLEKLMQVFPGRVFSRPEFTTLPPFIFSGAEFALIPSRDEPFGLVAVEFGRKGALGVGARVGGLGQMPGWWFTVESTTTKHMLSQFGDAIEEALASKKSVRAELRARAAKQRFPVVQWIEDLEILQTTAIMKHDKYASRTRSRPTSMDRTNLGQKRMSSRPPSRVGSAEPNDLLRPKSPGRPLTSAGIPQDPPVPNVDISRMGSVKGPGHVPQRTFDPLESLDEGSNDQTTTAEDFIPESRTSMEQTHSTSNGSAVYPIAFESAIGTTSKTELRDQRGRSPYNNAMSQLGPPYPLTDNFDCRLQATYNSPPQFPAWLENGSSLSLLRPEPTALRAAPAKLTPDAGYLAPLDPAISFPAMSSTDSLLDDSFLPNRSRVVSTLSLPSIVGERNDFQLQNVAPIFKDQNQDYAREFTVMLRDLNGKNSQKTCIEEYVEKSEKDWFNRFRKVKLGKRAEGAFHSNGSMAHLLGPGVDDDESQFALGADYVPPRGFRRYFLYKIGDWPVYSFFLALGQVMAANSFQITLLTGQTGGPPSKVYAVSAIYLIFSVIWWLLYRRVQSRFILASPFFFYGVSFCLIGVAPLIQNHYGRVWNQDVGTGFYAAASASGSIFFALNFGDQGGATMPMWVYRACVIQGTQQIYIAGLFWWASTLQRLQSAGQNVAMLQVTKPVVATSVGLSIGVIMMLIGLLLWIGLPDFYRQTPGSVPSFFKSVYRRKLILWFFGTVMIQNFFLALPYGRSWLYLWSNRSVPTWQIALLTVVFFVFLWMTILYLFSSLSKKHSWILPLFAIGLGIPRWAQTLWGVSGIGQYLPWTGSALASAFIGRALWLWLGVLDSLQGVGFGMVLLSTLTRLHVAFTLITAQVIGAATTIVAQAVGPDRTSPESVFPNLGINLKHGLAQPWFWVALSLNLSINLLAFKFFRKEQLMKP